MDPLSKKSSPPLLRLGHVISFCTFLREIGVPVDRYMRRQKLPVLCEDPDMFVPLARAWSFFADTQQQEEEALGWLVGADAGNQNLNAALLAQFKTAQTLFSGLKRFVKLARSEATHIDLGMYELETEVLIYTRYSDMRDSPGHLTSQAYQLGIILDLVRYFLGKEWTPPEIGIEHTVVPAILDNHFPGTRILTQQPMGYIAIPRNCLYRARHHTDISAQPAGNPVLRENLDDIDTLRLLLKSYLADGYPSAQFSAELFGVSERTLARKLSARGLTYGALIDEVRFEVAKEFLRKPNVQISYVASSVGFDEQANFTRMFRRMCGLTPSEFRKETMHC